MKELNRPLKLKTNDIVAFTSPCSGEAYAQPDRYRAAKAGVESLGLRIVETQYALRDSQWLYDHPQERAADLNKVYSYPEIKAVMPICGGEIEAIRVESFLDYDLLRENGKVETSYSANTFLAFSLVRAGRSCLYGPNAMEFANLDAYSMESVTRMLFSSEAIGEIPRNQDGADSAWRFISGAANSQGRLIGGCVEVLAKLPGRRIWPDADEFKDTILFLETPGQDMWPEKFEAFLRDLGTQGILRNITGLLFGKPGWGTNKVDPARSAAYDQAILRVLKENQRDDLPVITNMPIGHTFPMMTVPIGCLAEIDVVSQKLILKESATIDG